MGDFNMRKFVPLEFDSETSSLSTLKPSAIEIQFQKPQLWKSSGLLTLLCVDKIKRMAHREAWYGDNSNPFRRGPARARTTVDREDIEANTGGDVRRFRTEPTVRSFDSNANGDAISPSSDVRNSSSDPERIEMSGGTGRREHSSEKTAVDGNSIGRPPSEEQKARNRFVGRFFHKKHDTEVGTEDQKEKKSLKHKKFTFGNQIRATLFNSWINVLLVAAPVGIALEHVNGVPPAAVFVVNFIAIIPLAAMLSFATEEIAIRIGETLGGLMNATFGYICRPLLACHC
jgi:Ca2+:H+ antiporter